MRGRFGSRQQAEVSEGLWFVAVAFGRVDRYGGEEAGHAWREWCAVCSRAYGVQLQTGGIGIIAASLRRTLWLAVDGVPPRLDYWAALFDTA